MRGSSIRDVAFIFGVLSCVPALTPFGFGDGYIIILTFFRSCAQSLLYNRGDFLDPDCLECSLLPLHTR